MIPEDERPFNVRRILTAAKNYGDLNLIYTKRKKWKTLIGIPKTPTIIFTTDLILKEKMLTT